MEEQLILVDENDQAVGTNEKMMTHQEGWLHRAFSVVILNSNGEILLQKRAENKYHSGGLWSNTCCGHPRLGEDIIEAARRRLFEEMGIDCKLDVAFSFRYCVALSDKMTENEYDHVLLGKYDGPLPRPNPKEVSDWKWINRETLRADLLNQPENYTYWFRILMEKFDTDYCSLLTDY